MRLRVKRNRLDFGRWDLAILRVFSPRRNRESAIFAPPEPVTARFRPRLGLRKSLQPNLLVISAVIQAETLDIGSHFSVSWGVSLNQRNGSGPLALNVEDTTLWQQP